MGEKAIILTSPKKRFLDNLICGYFLSLVLLILNPLTVDCIYLVNFNLFPREIVFYLPIS